VLQRLLRRVGARERPLVCEQLLHSGQLPLERCRRRRRIVAARRRARQALARTAARREDIAHAGVGAIGVRAHPALGEGEGGLSASRGLG
jgi:hypothetical protein